MGWQLVCFMVAMLDIDEDDTLISSGIFGVLAIIIIKSIVNPIRLYVIKKRYNFYHFCNSKEVIFSKYMTSKAATNFKTEGEYFIKLAKEGKEFKSLPPRSQMFADDKIDNLIKTVSNQFLVEKNGK